MIHSMIAVKSVEMPAPRASFFVEAQTVQPLLSTYSQDTHRLLFRFTNNHKDSHLAPASSMLAVEHGQTVSGRLVKDSPGNMQAGNCSEH